MSAECGIENTPQGYKPPEVDVIPEDWNIYLLDSVANRGTGHTPDKAHPEYWGGNIKWISLQDSDRLDKLYIYDTAAKITPLGIKNSSAKMHLEGTVVLSRDAGVGKSAIMKEDMAVSQHFIAWKCGPLLNNHFLYYWLQSNKSEFERIAMGNTIKTIGLPYFRRLSIPLPTIVEQEAIAEALSDADAFIESLGQLIAKKRHIKQGAMQELLTGKKRLPGFSGEWKVRCVSELGDIVTGGTPRTDIEKFWGEGYPWITPTDISTHRDMCTSERTLTLEGLQAIRMLPSNTVLVTCIASIGKNAILRAEGGCNQQINAIIPSMNSSPEFLYYIFEANKQFLLANAGTTATSIVSKSTFGELTFKVPPLPEQESIASILSDMDSEITALEEKLAKTRQIKQGMMQELLTGRIRLI